MNYTILSSCHQINQTQYNEKNKCYIFSRAGITPWKNTLLKLKHLLTVSNIDFRILDNLIQWESYTALYRCTQDMQQCLMIIFHPHFSLNLHESLKNYTLKNIGVGWSPLAPSLSASTTDRFQQLLLVWNVVECPPAVTINHAQNKPKKYKVLFTKANHKKLTHLDSWKSIS